MSKLHNFIWFEKHRPSQLSDLSLSKEHKAAFATFILEDEIPHLLLEGPQGSGKTTVATILMESITCVTLTLNASGADRGIATARGKIKLFASSRAPKDHIKIVFLDEADQLTPEAQTALRNTMETYSKNCRFILTCNHVDKLIGPIQSRCMRFTFDRFPKRKVASLCKSILEKENVTGYTDDDISDLVTKFYPDIRTVVQNLQAATFSGEYNPKALGKLSADPKAVCDAILQGNITLVRKLVAGVTDFMYLYRYIVDELIPNVDAASEGKGMMIDGVVNAVRVESIVPDREINFIGCANDICGALEITVNF